MNRILEPMAQTMRTGDAALLQRYHAARDDAAFAELVARHGPMVYGVCVRTLQCRQDAEDAFQVTFLRLARHAGRLDDGELGGWLYAVARRVSLTSLRGRRRRRWVFWADSPEPLQKTPTELDVDFDAALAKLSAHERSAVVLCHLEGLSRAEAAKALGWTEGTLSGRLSRAMDKLRRKLGKKAPALLAASAAVVLPDRLSASTVVLVGQAEEAAIEDWASPGVLDLYLRVYAMRVLDRFGSLFSAIVASTLILVGASFGWQMLAAQPPSGGSAGSADEFRNRGTPPGPVGSSDYNPGRTPNDRVDVLGDIGSDGGGTAAREFFSSQRTGGRGKLGGEMTLLGAVSDFNAWARTKEIGKTQPPLTTDEVEAAIRHMEPGPSLSGEVCGWFKAIADTGSMAPAWSLYATEHWKTSSHELDVWFIELKISTGPQRNAKLRIREQFLRNRPLAAVDDHVKAIPPVLRTMVYQLKHASADVVVEMLNRSAKEKWGASKAVADHRTNSVIIEAPSNKGEAIRGAIRAIDELHK